MGRLNAQQSAEDRGPTRRELARSLAGLLVLGTAEVSSQTHRDPQPWYRRTIRWGQTNINEVDPRHYDIAWWRQHWRRTRVQGVIINAGGIIAYYPTAHPLHYRSRFLGQRDLYGELVRAAHEDGLVVLARMDSNRAHETFYRAHPDWFAVDAQGKPYRAGDLYLTCIDGPYYEEYLPQILRELIAWAKPEGFADNSWSGLDRNQICYCPYSRARFREATGKDLPARPDWSDPRYREWIEWSYERRLAIWDRNNRVCQEAGGPDCLWIGMVGGDWVSQGARFRDLKRICERAELILLDEQGRTPSIGFQGNAELGKRMHGLLGWEKLLPESMAMYQRAPTFRKASAVPAEARMWMVAGFAGGIQPWWHHVGAYQWDRRQFHIATDLLEWHERNATYLVRREPLATVGIVYSQRTADFYGRDRAFEKVGMPYYGFIQALVRARIPYIPVHVDHIARDAARLAVLILPNVAILEPPHLEAIEAFVRNGGGLIATGDTGLCDRWGEPQEDFALAALLGIHFSGKRLGRVTSGDTWAGRDHSYLRLDPPVGPEVDGPNRPEPRSVAQLRHPVLRGLEATDAIAFGGQINVVQPVADTVVPLTYIPPFPVYPPETAWPEIDKTDIPALVLRELPEGGRCAYLAADLDRLFAMDYLPDHGLILANLVRWAARDRVPLRVEGIGLLNCELYHQPGRVILHLVNLSGTGAWRAPAHEILPVGPFRIEVELRADVQPKSAKLLVAQRDTRFERMGTWVKLDLERIYEHEVVVWE